MNPQTSVATRENFISAQINRIESATKRINGGLNSLEEKLAVVLRPYETGNVQEAVPQERMPELAEVLSDRADELCGVSDRLELLLSRIELPGASKPTNAPCTTSDCGPGMKGYNAGQIIRR